MPAEKSQPVLPLLSGDDAVAAARGAGIPDVLAGPNVMRFALRNPKVARVLADMIDLAVLNGTLDARLREVAILRVAWRIGSVYEWSNHAPIGKRTGLTDEELAAIRTADAAMLGVGDMLAIAVVDEVLDNVVVSRPTLDAARSHLADDDALMELVTIAGSYRAIGSLLLSFAVPLEDHVEAWAPDGVAPTG
jgi:alkylhydroperoxidase family enzyme